MGISLSFYEFVKEYFGFKKGEIKGWQSFGIALASGITASVITNPLEIPKLRM